MKNEIKTETAAEYKADNFGDQAHDENEIIRTAKQYLGVRYKFGAWRRKTGR